RFLGAATSDDQDPGGAVDAGDVVLGAAQDQVVAVAHGGGAQPMGVGPGVGFGDGEGQPLSTVGQTGQPPLLQGGTAVPGQHLYPDRAGDGHEQQRAARSGGLGGH